MKRYTADQVLEVLMDSESDHSLFDHSESDRDEVVSERDAHVVTESSSHGRAADRLFTRRSGRRQSSPVCRRVDSDSSDCDTSDSEWTHSRPRSHSSFPGCRTRRGRTQRGRGRMCRVHQHGAAGDQTRATVNHPAEDTEPDDPEWHEINWQPKNIPFTENPGPIGDAAALESEQPLDFTELFISDVLFQNIVDQTNLYADQYIQAMGDTSKHARCHAWKPVTVSEMKTFMGLLFLTGIIHKPELEMYWCTDDMLATPYFNKVMPRNRFEIIWRFLHFNDNTTRPDNCTDRLYKIRPVLDHLVSKFHEMYQPKSNICIDEGMFLWRGCLAFRVYNPQKPIKYGVKSYILCDSDTGYCFNMKPYCGESATLGDTVVSLLDRLAGHGYRLFMDNLYNSVRLCERLLDVKTHVCGTIRKTEVNQRSFEMSEMLTLGLGKQSCVTKM
ncbi:piggyBac transposable element-derived protein 4-like [Megalobrama amblycephala]|uniref:piggyBac transposable element-derived protein 4-like n=1 Tax=Megalobrama amblycephala TaxID=75352 RepID=UPI002013E54E|nr:piggyBac transposable element-derived protein 4-like [Megalobrama amblycephala]